VASDEPEIEAKIPDDPNWKGPLEKGTQKYLNDVNALGLDADGVYEKAKAASAACKVV